MWFAHRQDDRVSHVEVRGPEFRGSLRGGAKSLFRFPTAQDGQVTKLALTEAMINALGLAALEQVRPDTIYAATGGGMGDSTMAAVAQVLTGLGCSATPELASAADANDSGERYATRHAELARYAGITFVQRTPTVGADRNEVLSERRV